MEDVGSDRGIMLSLKELDTEIRVQILDKAGCMSHNINIPWKCMTPIILPQAMGK